MEFKIKAIEELQGADYNPRVISPESFIKLQESLKTFGVCKPVIVNENGILIAGHQRTKAMKAVGIKEVPSYILKTKIAVHDEIRFNLMHNSIETENSETKIKTFNDLDFGYSLVQCEDIEVLKYKNGSILKEICRLLLKYGAWGSVIINEQGTVIHNNDYAAACKRINMPCLVYKMTNENALLFLEYMKIDYGRYDYEALGVKAYNQTYCQMNRISDTSLKRSSLYEKYVFPYIKKDMRIIDFGAGKKEYATRLKEQGYNIFAYEPHLKKLGTQKLDVRQVVKDINIIQKDIEENGLYDVVILDSVLNSITSLEFEHLVMTTCNSLLNDNGVFFTGTRSLEYLQGTSNVATNTRRTIEFLDKDNFSATFRNGVWTMQKFNSVETLKKLCKKYFEDVKVYKTNAKQIHAMCKKPKRFSKEEYERALNIEFNMEYPNGYKHNKHKKIVGTILNNL